MRLQVHARYFEKHVAELKDGTERIIRAYRKDVVDRQMELERLSDMAIEMFATACVLARTQHLLEERDEADARTSSQCATCSCASRDGAFARAEVRCNLRRTKNDAPSRAPCAKQVVTWSRVRCFPMKYQSTRTTIDEPIPPHCLRHLVADSERRFDLPRQSSDLDHSATGDFPRCGRQRVAARLRLAHGHARRRTEALLRRWRGRGRISLDVLMGPGAAARVLGRRDEHRRGGVARARPERRHARAAQDAQLAWLASGSTEFHPDYTYVAPDGAAYLAALGVQLVGVDYLSVEQFHSGHHKTHRTLLERGIVIVEGLLLSEPPAGRTTCVACR
jgi:hypothetical protein